MHYFNVEYGRELLNRKNAEMIQHPKLEYYFWRLKKTDLRQATNRDVNIKSFHS